ncbi:MAG: hypothetical protein ACKER6_01055, partial [Candidatus Hodgkinia cicadicola]
METFSTYEAALWTSDADLALTLGFKRLNDANSIPLTYRPTPSKAVIEAQSAALMVGRHNLAVLKGVANLVALRAAECFDCGYVNVWLPNEDHAIHATLIALLRSGDTVMDVAPAWGSQLRTEPFGMRLNVISAGWDDGGNVVNMAEVSAM